MLRAQNHAGVLGSLNWLEHSRVGRLSRRPMIDQK